MKRERSQLSFIIIALSSKIVNRKPTGISRQPEWPETFLPLKFERPTLAVARYFFAGRIRWLSYRNGLVGMLEFTLARKMTYALSIITDRIASARTHPSLVRMLSLVFLFFRNCDFYRDVVL